MSIKGKDKLWYGDSLYNNCTDHDLKNCKSQSACAYRDKQVFFGV
ncbi:hypothetical protein PSELUDRAFT_2970 [Vogesella sp. LIG4]|nr:hypothetical protein PSELUDRAFT_2970 [Vogesella sp. LIG4]